MKIHYIDTTFSIISPFFHITENISPVSCPVFITSILNATHYTLSSTLFSSYTDFVYLHLFFSLALKVYISNHF